MLMILKRPQSTQKLPVDCKKLAKMPQGSYLSFEVPRAFASRSSSSLLLEVSFEALEPQQAHMV